MNLTTKHLLLFVFSIGFLPIMAQSTTAPAGLSASYKKYANRIELSWKATAAQDKYIVHRRERQQKAFTPIDTIAQNRYVDRNKLRASTDYIYRVQAVNAQGIASELSTEATGALLTIAGGSNPGQKDTLQQANCIDLKFTDARITEARIAAKFLVKHNCAAIKTAQITLLRSDNEVLDDTDEVISSQSFKLSRTRGALAGANISGKTNGYLIAKITTEAGETLVVQKVE